MIAGPGWGARRRGARFGQVRSLRVVARVSVCGAEELIEAGGGDGGKEERRARPKIWRGNAL